MAVLHSTAANWGGQSPQSGTGGPGAPFGLTVQNTSFSAIDVRAFILPTLKAHGPRPGNPAGVFNAPGAGLPTMVQLQQQGNSHLNAYLQQSYITNLASISLSSHRDKFPVLTLGNMDPLAFVGSRRTVAGTMIFYMTDTSPLSQLLSPGYRYELLHADELPPFDLYLTFQTENAMWSSATITGITLLDEGMVLESANGEGIAVNYSFMALDCTPVTPGFFSLLVPLPFTRRQKAVVPRVTVETGSVRNGTSGSVLSSNITQLDLSTVENTTLTATNAPGPNYLAQLEQGFVAQPTTPQTPFSV